MKIEEFVKSFKNKMEELLQSEIILPSKQDYDYHPGDWTFMFNCAVFDLTREYNKKHNTKINLCVEPEAEKTPNGRGGYSDMLICSSDKKQRHIMIEHENFPKGRLKSVINKLSNSKAIHKLLITYFFPDFSKEQLIKELKSNIPKGVSLYLLIAPWDMKSGREYELIEISK